MYNNIHILSIGGLFSTCKYQRQNTYHSLLFVYMCGYFHLYAKIKWKPLYSRLGNKLNSSIYVEADTMFYLYMSTWPRNVNLCIHLHS